MDVILAILLSLVQGDANIPTDKNVPVKSQIQVTYTDLCNQALMENRPLVVGIYCAPAVPTGYLGYQGSFAGEDLGMFIGVPVAGKLERLQVQFPPETTVGQIRAAVEAFKVAPKGAPKKAVSQEARPFDQDQLLRSPGLDGDRLLDLLETADNDEIPASWPVSVPYPKGLATYTRARNTQRISILNNHGGNRRYDQHIIAAVPRTGLLKKWQVSGGMENIHGFKSAVFKLIPGVAMEFRGPAIPFGFGTLDGIKRDYPDGTLFIDHLTNASTGLTFELRAAEKQRGQWRRYVAFRDESQRPAGYAGLKGMTCATCHNSTDGPGTGSYGVGLVPGSDTIFSDPFLELER